MKRIYYDEFTKKKKYTSPSVVVFSCILEEGIATSSAIVTEPTGDTPEVTDWEDQNDNQDWEF